MSYIFFTINAPYVNAPKDLATGKINNFKQFQEGWHFGDGVRFSSSIINDSLEIISFLKNRGFAIIDAFPSINGDIRITTYPNGFYFAITVSNETGITFWIEDNDHNELFIKENLSFEELKKIVITSRLRWSTFEHSQRTIGMRPGRNLMILHSTTHQRREAVVYPLSTSNVQPNRMAEYADI